MSLKLHRRYDGHPRNYFVRIHLRRPLKWNVGCFLPSAWAQSRRLKVSLGSSGTGWTENSDSRINTGLLLSENALSTHIIRRTKLKTYQIYQSTTDTVAVEEAKQNGNKIVPVVKTYIVSNIIKMYPVTRLASDYLTQLKSVEELNTNALIDMAVVCVQ